MSNQKRQIRPIDRAFLDCVEDGDMRGAQAALDKGADLQVRTLGESNGLNIAARRGNSAMAEWLLAKGIDWQSIDNSRRTSMQQAAHDGNLEMVQVMLRHGVDPNWPQPDVLEDPLKPSLDGPRGFLALHEAAVNGNLPITKALLAAGADHHIQTRMIGRPLYFAVVNNNPEVAATLLAAGADPNGEKMVQEKGSNREPVYYQQSVLFNLQDNRQTKTLRMCLDAGADIERTNEKGQTIEEHIRAKGGGRDQVLAVYAEYRKMPVMDDATLESLDKKTLLTLNPQGYCLMDSPTTWQRFEEVHQKLAAIGEPLTYKDLQEGGKTAPTWLERGIRCFAAPQVLEYYVGAGGDLSAALMNKLQPTTAGQAVFDTQQVATAAKTELWQQSGADRMQFRSFCHAVPQEQKIDLGNYHVALATLEQPMAGVGR